MMPESNFLPDNFLPRLEKVLASGAAKKGLAEWQRDFGDAVFLTKHYVQPHGQLKKPMADRDGDTRPVFATLNRFLGKPIDLELRHQHRHCLFLLGDTGVGKTSLLLLLKAAHVTGLSSSDCRCELRRLSETRFEDLGAIKSPRRTILLLDGLNEDPKAAGDLIGSVNALLEATRHFHRVIIASRTSYFCDRRDPAHAIGAFVSGAYQCSTLYLAPFHDGLKEKYLKRRFGRMKDGNRSRVSQAIHNVGAFRDRPILLNHADDFIQSSGKQDHAFNALETITEAWLERESKTSKVSKDAMRNDCINLAQRMQMEPSRHRTAKVDGLKIITSLECQGRSLLRMIAGKEFRFTHISFQEYFVALGLIKGVYPSGKQRLPSGSLVIDLLIHRDNAASAWRALDLSNVSFHRVHLRSPDFSRCLLEFADYSDSAMLSASFDQAILTSWFAPRASFEGGSFQGAKATLSDLEAAHFAGTSFAHATFAESSFKGVRFEDCQLHHTLFADANLGAAQFGKSTIEDCSFKGAFLRGAKFDRVTFKQSRFDQASLAGARFEGCTFDNLSLQSADMRGAVIDGSVISAIKAGKVSHWETAAWAPEVASRLKLARKENDKNIARIRY
jgi:uncharacterized protein YjbI with pentapeptide repeats